jgi:hypothetical protein
MAHEKSNSCSAKGVSYLLRKGGPPALGGLLPAATTKLPPLADWLFDKCPESRQRRKQGVLGECEPSFQADTWTSSDQVGRTGKMSSGPGWAGPGPLRSHIPGSSWLLRPWQGSTVVQALLLGAGWGSVTSRVSSWPPSHHLSQQWMLGGGGKRRAGRKSKWQTLEPAELTTIPGLPGEWRISFWN